ncbi:DUF2911 domain-containing protein [Roseivirga sp. UBA838]|uniref:DUF2911 domain-containing protein n=1 Tax=Roseivirga sp. UBA838 TaxID=1947393 RepID=UPI00257A0669|nr:DUF2911 domain-containing protein [Roseivirga sp. UBA838]|tara:strand:- start:2988 stop:3833 length:846 start_codon:yes stop_codon:yes gene_type:complete
MKRIILSAIALMVATLGYAQIQMPAASPTFELKGTVGLSEVKVVYSRPSAKGRKVAGELIPYNEVWRTGANASTKISFSEDVKLEGNPVPAGEYALYTIFTEEEATIILSKNLTWWGSLGYDSKDDLLRFKVPVKHPSSHYETFTISFSDFTMNSAYLNMKWEHTKAMFKIESDVDAKVMAQIKSQVIDGSPQNPGVYFQAAGYYYDTERDAQQALEWVNKAIEGSGQKQYWVIHLKAKLLARLGKNTEAKAAAQESMKLAEEGGNPDYVRLNQKLIAGLK